MGLTSRENAPDEKILKSDVSIAKKYLSKDEIEDLGRIVSAFLDLAESAARRRVPMTMEDWATRMRKPEARRTHPAGFWLPISFQLRPLVLTQR